MKITVSRLLATCAVVFLCLTTMRVVKVFAATCPLTPGRPYKTSLSSAVYYISTDCKKRPIKNPDVYFSHFDSWRDVRIALRYDLSSIPDHDLSFLPWGTKRTYQNGTLIKTVDDPRVYALVDGKAYPVESEQVFQGLGFDWTWVEDVVPEVVQSRPVEAIITSVEQYPEKLVFKYPDSADIYVLDRTESGGFVKQHVTSLEDVSKMYRLDRVAVLPRETRFTDGPVFVPSSDTASNGSQSESTSSPASNAITSSTPSSSATSATSTSATNQSSPPLVSGGNAVVSSPSSSGATSTPSTVNLSVSLSAPVATSSPSTTILFTISYSNLGSGSASGVSVSTTVPSSTIFTSASSTGSWSCSNGAAPATSCIATIGTVAASATGSVIFAVTPYYALDGGRVTTTVSIADDGSLGADTNTANNSASSSVRVMRIPLTELATGRYLNQFMGGLYPNGTNTMPTAHATAGLSKASLIQQRDSSGTATSTGVIVLLSIGMTNTSVEFTQFETAFRTTLSGNRNVVVINGASGSEQYVTAWDQTADTQYTRIQTSVLAPRGLSESQVQAVWIKLASNTPTVSLAGGASADAYSLESSLGTVVRTLKSRYPNLQQVYFSSRSYAGYTTSTVNPEPYAYESGFAVKWLIEAQINQMDTGTVDTEAGNLNYDNGTAPWIAWGPYIWANGTTTSSEGISWSSSDFQSNGLNTNTTGGNKVRDELWDFFMSSPYTSWFSTSTLLGLPDLINNTYLGLRGGLYPNVTNTVPSAHRLAGLEKAGEIQPLDANGNVNTSTGKIVFLGVGLSNTLQAFSGFQYLLCGNTNYTARGAVYPTDENDSITPVNCVPQSNAGYNTTTLAVMNGADGGQVAYNWDGTTSLTNTNLSRISSTFFFSPYSAQQVQAIWLKLANAAPTTSLMTSTTTAVPEARIFQRQLGRIMRVLKQTYPNLKQVFISPRTYGGYDIIGLGPEPYAYEYGFSIKWLIESQINQMATGVEDSVSGNLNYTTGTVPWIDWGPYIWANATTSNSDGFNWRFTDGNRDESDARQDDRIHESLAGRLKVGQKLIDFFMNSEYTSWFRAQ